MSKARRIKQDPESTFPPATEDGYDPLPGEIVSDGGPAADGPDAEAGASTVRRMAILSDTPAGIRFYFDYQKHRGEIAFDAKPTPEVRALLKENGFRWDADVQVWAVPIRFAQREQDRLAAKRTYHKCAEMVRVEKGIEPASQPLPD